VFSRVGRFKAWRHGKKVPDSSFYGSFMEGANCMGKKGTTFESAIFEDHAKTMYLYK